MQTMSLPFLRTDKHGDVIVDIQVMPNAAKTHADGLAGEPDQPALKVRLNAPPVDGKANAALVKWLADQIGISKNSLEVVRGKTSRRKQLRLSAEAAAKANWYPLIQHLTVKPPAQRRTNRPLGMHSDYYSPISTDSSV